MRIAVITMVASYLVAPAAAAAQPRQASAEEPFPSRWAIPMEAEAPTPGLSLPVIDYTAPDGSLKLKRGIVVGRQVAPNATVGFGLFESLPKKQSPSQADNPVERTQKRSRKAAIGFSFKF